MYIQGVLANSDVDADGDKFEKHALADAMMTLVAQLPKAVTHNFTHDGTGKAIVGALEEVRYRPGDAAWIGRVRIFGPDIQDGLTQGSMGLGISFEVENRGLAADGVTRVVTLKRVRGVALIDKGYMYGPVVIEPEPLRIEFYEQE